MPFFYLINSYCTASGFKTHINNITYSLSTVIREEKALLRSSVVDVRGQCVQSLVFWNTFICLLAISNAIFGSVFVLCVRLVSGIHPLSC